MLGLENFHGRLLVRGEVRNATANTISIAKTKSLERFDFSIKYFSSFPIKKQLKIN